MEAFLEGDYNSLHSSQTSVMLCVLHNTTTARQHQALDHAMSPILVREGAALPNPFWLRPRWVYDFQMNEV